MRTLTISALVTALTGCANPINQHNAAKYHDWGMEAERAGDYQLAERNYERALANARIGYSPDAGISMAMYNLGRVKGHLCKHDEAEKLLTEALQLEEKVTGQKAALQRCGYLSWLDCTSIASSTPHLLLTSRGRFLQ